MDIQRKTTRHDIDIYTDYDILRYTDVIKRRWNPYEDEPIQQASALCYILRRIVNESDSRQAHLLEILEKVDKAIIFYNFDYELEILENLLKSVGIPFTEWNGHKHQPILTGDTWMYLVQYTAGAEGWNCITTNNIIFYSQTYSYKTLEQSKGRIDRVNTEFKDLYYYHLKSKASIDVAITRALNNKKRFNEKSWTDKMFK